jgi:hypothetical protein
MQPKDQKNLETIAHQLTRIADALRILADHSMPTTTITTIPAVNLSFTPPMGADVLEMEAWGRQVENAIEKAQRGWK